MSGAAWVLNGPPRATARPAGVAARVALFSGPRERSFVPALELRQYEPADADAVWDLHERALRDVGAFDPEYTVRQRL